MFKKINEFFISNIIPMAKRSTSFLNPTSSILNYSNKHRDRLGSNFPYRLSPGIKPARGHQSPSGVWIQQPHSSRN